MNPHVNARMVPPPAMAYADVRVEFTTITHGDARRGFVPAYHFCILNAAGMEVGHVSVRVGDSEHVRLAAGHIGYDVVEAHRGNHYAGKACLALAPWIATFHERVLITADPDNLASTRTMEWIGAVFLDEVDVPRGDPHHQRGSFRKKRYVWDPARRQA